MDKFVWRRNVPRSARESRLAHIWPRRHGPGRTACPSNTFALGIQLRDDGTGFHPARVIENADPCANSDGIALVAERELAWNSSHQEPEPLQLMRTGRFARPGHEFVAPRNAEGAT